MSFIMPSSDKLTLLREGTAIPASPLALNADRQWDIEYQKLVYRYYVAAGAGGVAVGVHTTQFEIRDSKHGLFQPLLELAAIELKELENQYNRPVIKVAGVCGKTEQAIKEAQTAKELGYDVVLLSLAALKNADDATLIQHCKEVSNVMPLIGFYLQPAVGGRILPYEFWRQFAEIENVVAIKMAPFNRYQTLDVVRAVAMSGREEDITLYTGNDDNIIMDLLTPYRIDTPLGLKVLRIKGGLLGQWAVWTRTAVELLSAIHQLTETGRDIPVEWLEKNAAYTDANAVVFDAAHSFKGCIPGINEVLRRQGLLPTNYCLNPDEVLSPGQSEEIDRIYREHSWLTDDDFIKQNLSDWKK